MVAATQQAFPRKCVRFEHLEALAIVAHSNGVGWPAYWRFVADDVGHLADCNTPKYRQMVERLLKIVCSGDDLGLEPPNSSPWEQA